MLPTPPHQRALTKRGSPIDADAAIDLTTLLEDQQENLKLRQISLTHHSIMDLLDDPGSPLYAQPHSMAEHFDAILTGARALGDLPSRAHCRDSDVTARV